MPPYAYMAQASNLINTEQAHEQLSEILNDLEFLYDAVRVQLEFEAFKQPMTVHSIYKSYPGTVNRKLINAALVDPV